MYVFTLHLTTHDVTTLNIYCMCSNLPTKFMGPSDFIVVALGYEVGGPNLFTKPNQMSTFEWCVVKCKFENEHYKNT